jgi:hypothetical protein
VPETSQEPEPTQSTNSETHNHSVSKHKAAGVAIAAATSPTVQTPEIEQPIESTPTGDTPPRGDPYTENQPEIDPGKPEVTTENNRAIPNDDDETQSLKKRKPLPIIVDALIGLILLLIGGLFGEFLAQKSTGDVWREAGSAPKFPPIDLLLWLAPPTMLILIYYLLVTRSKGLGAWLQRRRET